MSGTVSSPVWGSVIRASDFVNALGINTHIDFQNYGYQNLNTVSSAISYLGVHNVRDSVQNTNDLSWWSQVAEGVAQSGATLVARQTLDHIRFDDFLPEGSPANMQNWLNWAYNNLTFVTSTGQRELVTYTDANGQSIPLLNFLEGGNEEDDSYATQHGNSQWYAAALQGQTYNQSTGANWQIPYVWGSHKYHNAWQYTYPYSPNRNPYASGALNAHSMGVYQMGQSITDQSTETEFPRSGTSLPLQVINVSFGAGWTSQNNWQGDYGTVGDMSPYSDFANAHTYPQSGQMPDATISRLNGLANLAASTKPVITTEIGWNAANFAEPDIAKYVLDTAMDGIKDGDVKMYFYALFNDGAGQYGLMNSDGTPTQAGAALHNLICLMSDTGAYASSFSPAKLDYTLATASGDNSLVFEKSDGSYWLSVWNESGAPAHTDTLTLTTPAAAVLTYDPLTGTAISGGTINSGNGVSSATVTVSDHPVLIEVIPSSPSIMTPNGTVWSDEVITLTGTGTWSDQSSPVSKAQLLGISGDRIVQLYGSGNIVNLSGGTETITDNGTSNTFVIPPASQGLADITLSNGTVFDGNGDTFDFRSALAGTNWDGLQSDIGSYLHVTNSGGRAFVGISNTASGSTTNILQLENTPPLSLSTLLSHSIV